MQRRREWGREKSFSSQHNKIFSCETLFSSESYLYFRSLKEFSNFTPVTSFPKHLSKNIPCHIINYSLTDYLYYLMSALLPTHTHTHPPAEAAPIQCLALEQWSICRYEKANLNKSYYKNLREHLHMSILLAIFFFQTSTSIPILKILFLFPPI